jgi:hypothetical protein
MVKVKKGKMNLKFGSKQKMTPSRIESTMKYYERQEENEKLDTEMLPSHGRCPDYRQMYDNHIETGFAYD